LSAFFGVVPISLDGDVRDGVPRVADADEFQQQRYTCDHEARDAFVTEQGDRSAEIGALEGGSLRDAHVIVIGVFGAHDDGGGGRIDRRKVPPNARAR